MADPDVVAAMLHLALEGCVVVSAEVLARVSLEDFEAVRSLLELELAMLREERTRETVEDLRGFAVAAQAFLDRFPDWGR